jgi:hypothetical protein
MEKWLFNQLATEKTKNGWKPLRFTEAQYKEYGKDQTHLKRTYCQTGVGLTFRTDAKWLRLSYTILDKIKDYAIFDFLVDGIMVSSVEHEPVSLGQHENTYLIPESSGRQGMREVAIYFPQTIVIELHDLELSPGAVAETVEARPSQLLCLGDSITQGMVARHPSNTYPVLISNFLNMRLLNQGIGGYIFNADSLDVHMPYDPKMITVAYGTNDWSKCKGLAELQNKCGAYMQKLVNMFPNARIFMLTPIWRRNMHEQGERAFPFMSVSRVIEEASSSYPNVSVIDGLGLVPHSSSLFDDPGIHPADEGFLHMALHIVKGIQRK